jgi:hypothetical protein
MYIILAWILLYYLDKILIVKWNECFKIKIKKKIEVETQLFQFDTSVWIH